MVSATKTLGPLHFEDLDPKRFEDLVRQLAYDFKPWRRLEATGRAGSDDGFDARGFEIVEAQPVDDSDATKDESTTIGAEDRLWLVQCKRERAIGPQKLLGYLDDIKLNDQENLYGIVFAAACDFSKAARDQFRARCLELGFQEWHLWGKAELEDKLLRPENDGLLFAYFGVSLTIRRRSQRAELRAQLAMKRKVNRLLEPHQHEMLLLRSPDATMYPDSSSFTDFEKQALWVVRQYRGLNHIGAKFLIRRSLAYISDDGQAWDAMLCMNDARGNDLDDPWEPKSFYDAQRQEAWKAWNELPEHNKAWLEIEGVVPFEDILDIDEIGDEFVSEPHVYVQFTEVAGPYAYRQATVSSNHRMDGRELHVDSPADGRLSVFPTHLRDEPKS